MWGFDMIIPKLKTLFISSEIKKVTERLNYYHQIYTSSEIKNFLLKQLIDNKKNELDILNRILISKDDI